MHFDPGFDRCEEPGKEHEPPLANQPRQFVPGASGASAARPNGQAGSRRHAGRLVSAPRAPGPALRCSPPWPCRSRCPGSCPEPKAERPHSLHGLRPPALLHCAPPARSALARDHRVSRPKRHRPRPGSDW